MKFKYILLIVQFFVPLTMMGQGTITHKKTEQKQTSQVVKNKVTTQKKNSSRKVEDRCSTCGEYLSSCQYNGNHLIYYNVFFDCNVKDATITIDGVSNGKVNSSKSLKEGHHKIQIDAEWFDSYSANIEICSDQTYTINLTPTCKTVSGIRIETSQAVDLGLPSGTIWAGYNIGATSPEQIGGIYAWGETKTKSEYTWQNYFDVDQSKGYKYTWPNEYYTYKNKGKISIIGTKDDVATTSWGKAWQIPSYAQYKELGTSCDVKEDIFRGIKGYVIIGSNKKAIFFPDIYVNNEPCCYYWLGDLSDGKNWLKYARDGKAKQMNLKHIKNSSWLNEDDRYRGYPVRAILH